MLKLPINKDIILIAVGNSIFSAKIIFAGKTTLKLKNVKQRIYLNEIDFKEYFISDELIFDRTKILGYIPILEVDKFKAEVIKLNKHRIPKSWHNELIKFVISQICIKYKIEPKVFECTESKNRIVFNNERECKLAESEFSKAFIPLMNMFIEKIKLKNVNDYNRNIIATTKSEGEILRAWI